MSLPIPYTCRLICLSACMNTRVSLCERRTGHPVIPAWPSTIKISVVVLKSRRKLLRFYTMYFRLTSCHWSSRTCCFVYITTVERDITKKQECDTDQMQAWKKWQTVPLHCWWRVNEHFYVVCDILVQRLTIAVYEWPVCSSPSPMEYAWSQQDTLHSGHL